MTKESTKLAKSKLITRVILPIILVIVLATIAYFSLASSNKVLSKEDAIATGEDFINSFLMQDGSKATIKTITSEYGLYKLDVDIISDVVESYMTKDGKLFFPQALNIAEINGEEEATANDPSTPSAPSAVVTTKNDKPEIELFIMSYCPYGTQMQKGILPVLETLGDKINFDLKFVDYIMHGKQEIDENLVQYCIQAEEPNKLNDYLTCFLDEGKSEPCLAETKINTKKLSGCVSKTDKKYSINKNYTDKVAYRGSYPGFDVDKADVTKYSVGGSPTLIINGENISGARDSASLLSTVCSAFENAPKECDTVLSSASPSPGFGFGTSPSGGAAATCN